MTTRFTDHLLVGDHASRPAFGDVPQGTLYSCTDHNLIYQSDGVSAWSTWASLGGAVTAAMNQLSGNVTMTNTDTYYDGPSLSLLAGTYVLSGTITVDANDASTLMTAKLWNGTTVLASTESLSYGGAAGRKYVSLSLSGYVVLSGTETWKISAAGNGSPGTILKAAPNNGAGDNASTLVAMKIG